MKPIFCSVLQLAILICFVPTRSGGCTCGPPPPDFLSTLRQVFSAYQTAGKSTDVLVVTKGIVTGLTANNRGVRLKLLHNYYGATYSDTVTIWGTDGIDCRLNIVSYYYQPADTFIFLMNRNISKDYPYEDTSDFHVSACGTGYLTIKNDSVFGGYPGTFAWTGFPLSSFEDSLNHSVHTLKVEPGEFPLLNMKVYPNPATDYLMIEGAAGGTADVFSILGSSLLRCAIMTTRQNLPISALPVGTYLLYITTKDGKDGMLRFVKE